MVVGSRFGGTARNGAQREVTHKGVSASAPTPSIFLYERDYKKITTSLRLGSERSSSLKEERNPPRLVKEGMGWWKRFFHKNTKAER